MLSLDWGFLRNSAVITNPLKGDAPAEMTAADFHKNFANTMASEDSDRAYEEFAVHESRNVLRDCLGKSGHVDLDRPHVPLLFVSGDSDRIIPEKLNEKNARAYTHKASITDFVEFRARGHFICGQPGWEKVAAHITGWLTAYAQPAIAA
jgi:pimeloyl-ACP methyl ester carboxylesterase